MEDLCSARREARRLIQNHSCRQTKIAMIEVLMCFTEFSHEREELLQLTESLVEEISLEPSDEIIALSIARSEETFAGGGSHITPKIDQILWDTDPDLAHALLLSEETGYVKSKEVLQSSKESSRRSLAEEAAFQRSLKGMTLKQKNEALQARERSQKKR